MDFFGFSPTDAAYTAWGLELSQQMIDFFFKQTMLGVAAYLLGAFIIIAKLTRTAQWRDLFVYLGIGFIVVFFIVQPRYEPSRIQSFQDDTDSSLVKPQAMPLIMAYANYWTDQTMSAMIHLGGHLFPEQLDFIKQHFRIQQITLANQRRLKAGLTDMVLQERLQDFIHDEYWPSLAVVGRHLSPDDPLIEQHYSNSDQQQWGVIKQDINSFITNDDQWKVTTDYFNALLPNPSLPYIDQIQQSILKSTVYQTHISLNQQIASSIYNFWPHVLGIMNANLWLALVPLILLIFISGQWSWMQYWGRFFVWSKSLWLSGFLAYGCSLIALKAQGSVLSPSFAVIGAYLLIVLTLSSAWLLLRLK